MTAAAMSTTVTASASMASATATTFSHCARYAQGKK